MATCFFRGCSAPVDDSTPDAWRCTFHRGRSRCAVADCDNQAYARQLCVRHGGKVLCRHDGCQARVRVGNFCPQHGATRAKVYCAHEHGCTNVAQLRGLCVKHGGGRVCKLDGCTTFARQGGYCAKHTRHVKANPPTRLPPGVSTGAARCPQNKDAHGWTTEDDSGGDEDALMLDFLRPTPTFETMPRYDSHDSHDASGLPRWRDDLARPTVPGRGADDNFDMDILAMLLTM